MVTNFCKLAHMFRHNGRQVRSANRRIACWYDSAGSAFRKPTTTGGTPAAAQIRVSPPACTARKSRSFNAVPTTGSAP